MDVVAIVNPIAGACKQGSALRTALDRLRAMGIRVDIRTTTGPGDGELFARQAGGSADYVIAGGGDGTVREVVQGLVGTATPLLIWPTGTENIIAKALGFRANSDLIPQCITAGRTARLDVGVANGRCFTVVAGMGFDAEVVERLVKMRRGHITHLSYIDPIWRTFCTHKFPRFRIFHDGKPWYEGRGMVFVGNIWRYSLGLPVVRDAIGDDGLLDVLVLPCRNQFELVAHSVRTLLWRHIEHGGARYMRFKRLRVEAATAVPLELDGDSAGKLPVDFEVRPGALLVRLPPV